MSSIDFQHLQAGVAYKHLARHADGHLLINPTQDMDFWPVAYRSKSFTGTDSDDAFNKVVAGLPAVWSGTSSTASLNVVKDSDGNVVSATSVAVKCLFDLGTYRPTHAVSGRRINVIHLNIYPLTGDIHYTCVSSPPATTRDFGVQETDIYFQDYAIPEWEYGHELYVVQPTGCRYYGVAVFASYSQRTSYSQDCSAVKLSITGGLWGYSGWPN